MILKNLPQSQNKEAFLSCATRESLLYVEELHQEYRLENTQSSLSLFVLLKGKGQFSINNKKYPLGGTDYLVLNSGSVVSMHLDAKSIPLLLVFSAQLLAEFPNIPHLFYKNSTNFPDFQLLERLHLGPSGNMISSLSELFELSTSCASFHALKADLLVRSIYLSLIAQLVEAEKTVQSLPVIKRSSQIEIFKSIDFAREWLQSNYSNPIRIEELSRIISMSTEHFIRLFKTAFGVSPNQYLIELRLQKAHALFAQPNPLSVSEVCNAVGYSSETSFSLLFKRRFGKSPSDFKKQRVINFR
tara:strand:- start:13227 stop:14129 length:903 start_codon:yes stop_codon:yes gene_type:complete